MLGIGCSFPVFISLCLKTAIRKLFFSVDEERISCYSEQKGGVSMQPLTVTDVKNRLDPVFEAYGVHKAVLFGSVAKGNATEKSDLDLLVDSGLRGLRFVGLIEAVHDAVGVPVDLLDVTHVEKDSKIANEIALTGVAIYEK
jgi:hypothetical protein